MSEFYSVYYSLVEVLLHSTHKRTVEKLLVFVLHGAYNTAAVLGYLLVKNNKSCILEAFVFALLGRIFLGGGAPSCCIHSRCCPIYLLET